GGCLVLMRCSLAGARRGAGEGRGAPAFPWAVPAVDIHTVSAGGGSIARVDAGGVLTLGPDGAGSDPGPAAYRRGGTNATDTDAQLVLGRLRSGPFADGAMTLDAEWPRPAIAV